MHDKRVGGGGGLQKVLNLECMFIMENYDPV
jgi:hypothetical protein